MPYNTKKNKKHSKKRSIKMIGGSKLSTTTDKSNTTNVSATTVKQPTADTTADTSPTANTSPTADTSPTANTTADTSPTADTSADTSLSADDITNEDIMEEIKKRNQVQILPSTSILTDNIDTIKKAFVLRGANDFGEFLGVDISDKIALNKALKDIKESLSNPENTQEILEIIGLAANKAGLYLKAAEPFIEPFINTTIDKGTMMVDKSLDSAQTLIGNVIKEIPVLGLFIAGIQVAERMGEAGLASINATATIFGNAAETAEAAKLNYEKMKKSQTNPGIQSSPKEETKEETKEEPKVNQQGGGIKVADRVRKSITEFLTPTITLSKVKKMFMTRKHKPKKSKKTYKRH